MNPNQPGRRPLRPLDSSQLRPQRRVFDIAPPGRTPASATSRPMLSGQQPAVRDMSMRPASQPAPAPTPGSGIAGHRPMLDPHQAAESQPPTAASMEFAPPASGPSPDSAPGHRVAPAIARPQPTPQAMPQAVAPRPPQASMQSAAPQPQPMAALPPTQQPPAAVHRPQPSPQTAVLADDIPAHIEPMHINDEPVLISKHVPHDQSTKWRWIIAGTLVVFLLLVIFDVLLDADFITLRQVPHTHFF